MQLFSADATIFKKKEFDNENLKKLTSKVGSIKLLWSQRQPVVSKEFILSQEIKKSLVHCVDKNFQLT